MTDCHRMNGLPAPQCQRHEAPRTQTEDHSAHYRAMLLRDLAALRIPASRLARAAASTEAARRMTDADRAECVRLWRQGMATEAIAEAVGWCPKSVRRAIVRAVGEDAYYAQRMESATMASRRTAKARLAKAGKHTRHPLVAPTTAQESRP